MEVATALFSSIMQLSRARDSAIAGLEIGN